MMQVYQNWNNDGYLTYTGAETLSLFKQLNDEIYHQPLEEIGIFFAFDIDSVREGIESLRKRGLLKEGEKILKYGCGCFGVDGSFEKRLAFINERKRRMIEECDPYEVYVYEYNNFECCIDYDGDQRAVEAVLGIYGLERTKAALEERRFNRCGTIEGIWEAYNKD